MRSLAELQTAFCDALITGDDPPSELLDELVDDGLAAQRFNVYRNNFIVLNGDALADMYPVVQRLVGESAFRALATAYVRRHPPTDRTLLLYGERFPEFLETVPGLAGLPYLADVARLEFAWTAAYHAEDASPLEKQSVAAIDADDLADCRLEPHPSVHCIESVHPLYRIWTNNLDGEAAEVVSLDEGPSRVIVIRPSADVEVREVSKGEILFLLGLQAGESIGEAVAKASAGDASFQPSDFFARHLFDGTFVSIGNPRTSPITRRD